MNGEASPLIREIRERKAHGRGGGADSENLGVVGNTGDIQGFFSY